LQNYGDYTGRKRGPSGNVACRVCLRLQLIG
jgi:hypothetical protein